MDRSGLNHWGFGRVSGTQFTVPAAVAIGRDGLDLTIGYVTHMKSTGNHVAVRCVLSLDMFGKEPCGCGNGAHYFNFDRAFGDRAELASERFTRPLELQTPQGLQARSGPCRTMSWRGSTDLMTRSMLVGSEPSGPSATIPTFLHDFYRVLGDNEHMTAATKDQDRSTPVDPEQLRDEVRSKYREVAETPDAEFHFHTGRDLARRCRYDMAAVDDLPDYAVESFAGVANPFALRDIELGERVVDVGSGAGFDSFLAARSVGADGHVVGVDMTPQMLAKSRKLATQLGHDNVDFREGLAESIPVDDGWADVVISNGVINLCPDKKLVFEEIFRVLRPGGTLQFADIANGRPVPEEAMRDIDLWTG
jgi:arsenite methyltransferase